MILTFTVDMPPSVNKIWRIGPGSRVYKAPAYTAWARSAGWEIAAKRPGRFPAGTKVAMTVKAGKPKRARDIDNLSKALLDLMQGVGIVDNDRDVVDLHLAWDNTVPDGRVQVELRSIERRAA